MKFYIAGPMRGLPYYNFPAFDLKARELRQRGHEVISPAEMDREHGFDGSNLPFGYDTSESPQGFDLNAAMERDAQAVIACDAVAVLDGWEKSKGASAEVALCRALGKPVVDAVTLEPIEFLSTVNPLDLEPADVVPFETCAVEPGDTDKFGTGAVRSADADRERWDLLSPIGLRRLAETYAEGSAKYGDFNWEKGMPVSDILNHAIRHVFLYLSGDRTEDHLAHAGWNLLAAMHSEELWPDLNEGKLRRVGCAPPREVGRL